MINFLSCFLSFFFFFIWGMLVFKLENIHFHILDHVCAFLLGYCVNHSFLLVVTPYCSLLQWTALICVTKRTLLKWQRVALRPGYRDHTLLSQRIARGSRLSPVNACAILWRGPQGKERGSLSKGITAFYQSAKWALTNTTEAFCSGTTPNQNHSDNPLPNCQPSETVCNLKCLLLC